MEVTGGKVLFERLRAANRAVSHVLDRDFAPTAGDQGLGHRYRLDPYVRGWLFLAAVMDLCSRQILG
jgi:hypothetical protein